ncbi:MAG TPA: DUF2203 family protein [Longimicrobiaceae bacterium]
MSVRAFTVAQANAMVPSLEELFARIDEIRAVIGERHEKLQVLELLWGDQLEQAGNPDGAEAADLRAGMEDGVLEIQRLIRERILALGLRFPMGGLAHGLVDFPTTWQGRWVLLCWRRGEPELVAWHELDTGFAGRQEITPDQSRRMGSEDLSGDEEEEGGAWM